MTHDTHDDDDDNGPLTVINSTAAEKLAEFVARFENLNTDIAAIREDQKVVMTEVGAAGFDKKVFRELIRIRAGDKAKLAEQQSQLELYQSAVEGRV